jgi:hypothetical protein
VVPHGERDVEREAPWNAGAAQMRHERSARSTRPPGTRAPSTPGALAERHLLWRAPRRHLELADIRTGAVGRTGKFTTLHLYRPATSLTPVFDCPGTSLTMGETAMVFGRHAIILVGGYSPTSYTDRGATIVPVQSSETCTTAGCARSRWTSAVRRVGVAAGRGAHAERSARTTRRARRCVG